MLPCIISAKYTNTLFTAVLCTKKAQKAENLILYMTMKKTDANIIGNKEKVTALILLRKIICKSSHLNGRTGMTLCNGRTFRLWRNSTFLSRVYSRAMEFQDFWSIGAPKKEIDKTDMNSSYLDLILHSWKWVAKHLLTSEEIKPGDIENTYWSIFDPVRWLILFLLNKNVKKAFISIMPSAWKNEYIFHFKYPFLLGIWSFKKVK